MIRNARRIRKQRFRSMKDKIMKNQELEGWRLRKFKAGE